MVESYLLTELPLEEVGRRCSLPPATVDAYTHLFFACRENPGASDWLMTRVVGGGPWNSFAGGRLDVLWRYAGFAAGHRALEVVIAITTDRPLPGWVRTSGSKSRAYDERRLRLLGKLTLAAMTARSDAELGPLLEARERLRVLDRQAGNAAGEDQALSAMEQLLKGLGSPRAPAPGKKARAQAAHPKPRMRGHNPVGGRGADRHSPVAVLLGLGK
jgi:hypothetical protein